MAFHHVVSGAVSVGLRQLLNVDETGLFLFHPALSPQDGRFGQRFDPRALLRSGRGFLFEAPKAVFPVVTQTILAKATPNHVFGHYGLVAGFDLQDVIDRHPGPFEFLVGVVVTVKGEPYLRPSCKGYSALAFPPVFLSKRVDGFHRTRFAEVECHGCC